MARPTQRELDLGYCEEAQTYCSVAEERYQQGRADAIDELKSKKDEIIKWMIKRDKEGYGTTNGELLDHIFELADMIGGDGK